MWRFSSLLNLFPYMLGTCATIFLIRSHSSFCLFNKRRQSRKHVIPLTKPIIEQRNHALPVLLSWLAHVVVEVWDYLEFTKESSGSSIPRKMVESGKLVSFFVSMGMTCLGHTRRYFEFNHILPSFSKSNPPRKSWSVRLLKVDKRELWSLYFPRNGWKRQTLLN
jgi:hypothetical protein